MHSKMGWYVAGVENKSRYPCHNRDANCSATYTFDDWHCHGCTHQGKSQKDKKFRMIENQK